MTAGAPGASRDLLLRGRAVLGGHVVEDGLVAVRADRIAYAGTVAGWPGAADLPDPSPDRLLLPGLVDVHCHGGGGADFSSADLDGARAAVAEHRASGTTTIVASLVSAPPAVLRERIDLLAPLVAAGELAGLHLEGPFLAAARCGAQDPAALLPGDPDLLRDLLTVAPGAVVSLTLAPETARVLDLLGVLREHGVLPSLGHTDADAGTTTGVIGAAARTGQVSATHLFNAMAPFAARAPGPIAACLAAAARREMVVELVADGVHLSPDTVAMVFGLLDPGQIALVTDATAAAGRPDGRYRLGPFPVEVRAGTARLVRPDGLPGAIAGGTAHLLDVLRHTTQQAGVALGPAVEAASRTPARLLGLAPRVGELTAGASADVLVTDLRLRPLAVLRAGRWLPEVA